MLQEAGGEQEGAFLRLLEQCKCFPGQREGDVANLRRKLKRLAAVGREHRDGVTWGGRTPLPSRVRCGRGTERRVKQSLLNVS